MALFDIYGYSRETQDKFVDYYTVGPRAGNIPLEGVFTFTNRDEDDYIYVAYKTFPGEGQLDGQNRLVSFCFDEEDKEKGEFATFSHNGYGYDDPGVSRLSKSKTSCPVDSTEWRDAILENLLGELHHLSINYSNWHEFSPFAIEGAKVAPLSAFDPQVEENLESRYLRPKKGDDEPGKDSDYNRLVAACKKESKLSEFNKIMNRLAKDFSLDKPLNIKLIEYMDDGVKRPYGVAYFYDGFTVVFEKGDYSRHSDWYIEKNTPYGIKHQELNVGKRFDSGWSPSSLTMESYENYFKPFFAKWLDRIQDKWRISLDDDTEEAVAEVLGENTLIRRKINESAEKKYVIYEDAPDFDGYLSPYGELVGYPEDAEVFDSVDEAKEELADVEKGKFSESKKSIKESLIPSGFKYKKSDFTSYIKRLNKIFSDALGFGVKLVDKWPGSDFEGRFRLVPVDVEEAKQKSGFKDTYYITEYGFEFGAASDVIETLYQNLKDKLDIYETDTYKDSDKHSFLTVSLGEDEPDIDIRRESELNYSVCVEFEERNKAWNMNQYGTVYDYSGTPEARENNKKFSSDYYGTDSFNGKINLYRIATKKFVLVSDYNEGDDNNRIISKPMSASQAIEAYYDELNGNPNNEKAIKEGILDIFLKVYGEHTRVDVKDVEKAVELYGKSKATWEKRYPGDEAQVWVHPKYRK